MQNAYNFFLRVFNVEDIKVDFPIAKIENMFNSILIQVTIYRWHMLFKMKFKFYDTKQISYVKMHDKYMTIFTPPLKSLDFCPIV